MNRMPKRQCDYRKRLEKSLDRFIKWEEIKSRSVFCPTLRYESTLQRIRCKGEIVSR